MHLHFLHCLITIHLHHYLSCLTQSPFCLFIFPYSLCLDIGFSCYIWQVFNLFSKIVTYQLFRTCNVFISNLQHLHHFALTLTKTSELNGVKNLHLIKIHNRIMHVLRIKYFLRNQISQHSTIPLQIVCFCFLFTEGKSLSFEVPQFNMN